MKFLIINLIAVVLLGFFLSPQLFSSQFAWAADEGIVSCGTGSSGSPTDCNLKKLIDMINKIITTIMEVIAVGSIIVIVYAGGMTMWEASQGKSADSYKKMLWNVVIGFFFALCSWLIIKEIVSLFASDAIKPAIDYVFSS